MNKPTLIKIVTTCIILSAILYVFPIKLSAALSEKETLSECMPSFTEGYIDYEGVEEFHKNLLDDESNLFYIYSHEYFIESVTEFIVEPRNSIRNFILNGQSIFSKDFNQKENEKDEEIEEIVEDDPIYIDHFSAVPINRIHYIGDEISHLDIQVEVSYSDGTIVYNPEGWSAHILNSNGTISTKYTSTENFVLVSYKGWSAFVGIIAYSREVNTGVQTNNLITPNLSSKFNQNDLNCLYAQVYQEIGICQSTPLQRMDIISVIFNRYIYWCGNQGPLIGQVLQIPNQIWLKGSWCIDGRNRVPSTVNSIPVNMLQTIMNECEYVYTLYLTTGRTTNSAFYWNGYKARSHWWNNGKVWLGINYN